MMTSERHTSLAESFLLMGTVVTIRVVGESGPHVMRASIDRAQDAMRAVEQVCSRFDEQSALRALCRTSGHSVPVPPVLFHALKVAMEVAELTDGVFDPTIGRRLELLGFDRHYLTGETVSSDFAADTDATFRDVTLVEDGFRVSLAQPLSLDLGAVAKGLAVDAAAHELASHEGFAIDAGGDVYVGGLDPDGTLWHVGIENPLMANGLAEVVTLTDSAVCTSGSYKRRSPADATKHHLIDAKTGESVDGLLSCTVIGPQAILADVVATAAFLLGPDRALPFITKMGLEGLCVTAGSDIQRTANFGGVGR